MCLTEYDRKVVVKGIWEKDLKKVVIFNKKFIIFRMLYTKKYKLWC